jgi:hypothetical protein
MIRCNKCKKQIEDVNKKIFIQIREMEYIDTDKTLIKIYFCPDCWNSIKNLNGVPALFKGNVRQMIKEWGLNELFD